MSNHIRLLFATTIALIAFGLAASSASAAEVTIEPAGAITATSLGLLTYSTELTVTTCRMTLTGSLHRGPIAKTVGNLIGYITRVADSCNEGARWEILEAGRTSGQNPANVLWHLRYQSILGTLPANVTGILVLMDSSNLLLTVPSIFGTQTCLYEGSLGLLLAVTGSNPYSSGLMRTLEESIPLKTSALNTGLCPSSKRYRGSFSIAPTQRITRT